MLQTEAGGDGDAGILSPRQSHLCPEKWQMGLVARHGCRQSTQEVGPPWLAACPCLGAVPIAQQSQSVK